MVTLKPSILTPAPLQFKSLICNGELPHYVVGAKISEDLNHLLTYRRRIVFANSDFPAGAKTGATEESVYHFKFTSGPAPSSAGLKLRFEFILSTAADNSCAGDPYLYYSLNGTNSDELHPNTVDLVTSHDLVNSPGTWSTASVYMDLSSNTEYEGVLYMKDYIVVVAAVAFEECIGELDEAEANVQDPRRFSFARPLLDDDHYQMAVTADELWQHAAPMVLCHVERYEAVENPGLTCTSGTFTNPFDGSYSVASDTIGWTVDCQYHNNRASDGVPVKGYVYGKYLDDTRFRLIDANGALTLSNWSTVGASVGWGSFTTTVSGTQATQKIDLQLCDAGAGQPGLVSLYLFEYEA
jgi:hypothetical protein